MTTSNEPALRTAAAVHPTAVHPTASDEEAVAIVAAIEVLWPKPFAAVAPTTSRDRSWRFSGRWWARPVAIRRDRPWR